MSFLRPTLHHPRKLVKFYTVLRHLSYNISVSFLNVLKVRRNTWGTTELYLKDAVEFRSRPTKNSCRKVREKFKVF